MKYLLNVALLLSFLVLGRSSAHALPPPALIVPNFTTTIWKVDQMYIQTVPVSDSSIYRVRFFFDTDKAAYINFDRVGAASYSWDYDATLKKVTLWNKPRTKMLDQFTIVALSSTALVMTSNKTDANTGVPITVEYRLLADPNFVPATVSSQ